MTNIMDCQEWLALKKHQEKIAALKMQDCFLTDSERFTRFTLSLGDLLLDFSKNRIVSETIFLLCQLTHACDLSNKIKQLFQGKTVNYSEKRPALHTALRSFDINLNINGNNILKDIQQTLAKMKVFSEKVRSGIWRGVTNKPIKHLVNIGIGGSHLGPLMTTYALKPYAKQGLNCHFISNIDSLHLHQTLAQVDPESTLFIISSKSFTTLETITNASTVREWLQNKLGKKDLSSHFVAVTAAFELAKQFNIPDENIFPLWEWVGGRYSIWSAIGLPLALMIGMEHFLEFLEGAKIVDQHFFSQEFSQNIPVILALLGIWYINFFDAAHHAIIPYSHQLHYFRSYLQQLEMESNGKNISETGTQLDFLTAPVILGEQGCNGQHAFHQLLHQGPHFIPVDFILVGQDHHNLLQHHDILIGSGLSQAEALMRGKTFNEAFLELQKEGYSPKEATFLAKHKVIPGNRPSNILFLKKITPTTLGMLIAIYEHKTFVQGALWKINSFDQWGVELGKTLLSNILSDLKQNQNVHKHDASTMGLIQYYKKMRNNL